eukprot:CAMPEP_0116976492 /NCGR_PEP_ID=MMETSP0467-20121206/56521_1 /TAXON_ID=283647 /ORGANISM="Mesodinium pulex, Strain SPMC105" /LENGTH=110 /DNA_ID=CAMNT_0004669287 /DNA_START=237 /DNA_END=569 /DNA_ORIENTATION=-
MVILPTRDLAQQVYNVCNHITKDMPKVPTIGLMIGGQEKELDLQNLDLDNPISDSYKLQDIDIDNNVTVPNDQDIKISKKTINDPSNNILICTPGTVYFNVPQEKLLKCE